MTGTAWSWSGNPGDEDAAGAALAPVLLVGGVAVLVATTGAAVAAATGAEIDPTRADRIGLALASVTVVAAVVVFALAAVRAVVVGERAVAWAGTAALVYGLAAVAAAQVIGPVVARAPGPVLPSVSSAGRVAMLILLMGGLVAARRTVPMGLGGVVALAVVLVAGLGGLFHLAPGAGPAFAIDRFGAADASPLAVQLTVVAAWLVVGVAYAVRGIRRRWLYGWCGLMVLSVTLADLARASSDGPADPLWLGGMAVAAVGMVAAAVTATFELVQVLGDQRRELFAYELDRRATEAREKAGKTDERARRHEVVNALLAIEGGAMVLGQQREGGPTDAGVRADLQAGVRMIRSLLVAGSGGTSGTAGSVGTGSVDLRAAVVSVLDELGWDGRVAADVPPGLWGRGSAAQVSEVVRLLLLNAVGRDPNGRIVVRGRSVPGWAVVSVEDDGPPLTDDDLGALAAGLEGRLPASGDVPDLGVLVAGRLLRSQGGDLTVGRLTGSGSSFELRLPRPEAPGTGSGS